MAKDFAAKLAGESSLYASTNSEANIAAKRKCPGNLVRLSSYVVKELTKVADYVQPASASQSYSVQDIRCVLRCGTTLVRQQLPSRPVK